MPIKKIQFPKLLTQVKGRIVEILVLVLNKIALSHGDTHIDYWTNFSATRHHNLTKIKTQHSALCW